MTLERSLDICIHSTREVGELLFKHHFIVTNFSENKSAKRVFETYNKRGTDDDLSIGYDLVNFLHTICFEPKSKGLQVNTIRLRLFKVARKLVTTARKIYSKLSSSNVYLREFYAVFR